MKPIILLALIVAFLMPMQTHADNPNPLALHDCLYLLGTPSTMTLDPDVIPHIWTDVDDADATPFVNLVAIDQIVFLGYAPDEFRSLEWYGKSAGWQGIDMREWLHTGLLTFEDADGVLVARAEVYEYPPLDAFLVWITELTQRDNGHGKYFGYHPLDNPNGGDCDFVIDSYEFERALGWEQ